MKRLPSLRRFAGQRRAPPPGLLPALVMALALVGCSSGSSSANRTARAIPPVPAALRVTSPAFAPGATLPRRFTCDGAGREPPLSVAHVPAGAATLALSLEDPDAPGGAFDHWVAFDIPATTRALSPVPARALQARNDFGSTGYGAPCPPRGAASHRYVFTVYAVSHRLALPNGTPARRVIGNVRGATIAEGQILARYSRATSP